MTMIEALPLHNELERLSDLYSLELLDTAKEERFDRLTRIARQSLLVEMCYLALIDGNRQWFKSKCGVSQNSTDRRISFCDHTITHDAMLIVPDALADERFRENPLVTGEPYIRFYAGYPLKGPHGQNVGTFCIADSVPRELNSLDQKMLKDFAMMAERELNMMDLIQSQSELLETQSQLERVSKNLQRELSDASGYVRMQLPEPFHSPQISLDWQYISSSQLGGDMFGFQQISSDRYLFYLLDVAGHGVGALLLAVTVQNTIKQMLTEASSQIDPAEMLRRLNHTFRMENHQNRFFTIWLGIADFSNHTITYSSGGQPAPVLSSPTGQVTRLGERSWIIGIDENATFENSQVEFSPGDRLLLFSDGVIELTGPDESVFGRKRLEQILLNHCATPQSSLKSVVDKISQWTGEKDFADDITIMELKLSS